MLENPAAWRRAVARVCSAPREKYLRTALLFRAVPGLGAAEQAEITKRALRRLHAENKMILRVCALIETELPYSAELPEIRRLLGRNGEELFSAQLALLRAEGREDVAAADQMKQEILARGDCIRLSQLALKGSDLSGEGKETGMLLNAALDAVIKDRVPNKKAELLQYLKQRSADKTEQ